MSHSLILRQGALTKAFSIVSYLTREEVIRMAEAMTGRHQTRDRLLIKLLFATGLRISEALSLTTQMIGTHEGKAVLYIRGKGNKPRLVACPDSFAYQLKSYAFDNGMNPEDKIFGIDRRRAWQIITKVGKDANINKRIYPHLLRHSDAIERLRQTGNPKALQLHLGHNSMTMTMRYLSTLTAEDAVRINQNVDIDL
jgi:site-specific recombinase XerD